VKQAKYRYDADMGKENMDTSADQVAMLFSTDWFLPYWSLLGIEAERQKGCVQTGCRQIVRGFVGRAVEYYHCEFSTQRVKNTRSKILALGKNCGLANASERAFSDLVASQKERQQLATNAWLFGIMAEKLATNEELDAATREVLRKRKNAGSANLNAEFERACEESSTEWDSYVRSLTRGLPTSLCDFLSVDLLSLAELNRVLIQLDSGQRNELLKTFKLAAKSLTGTEPEGAW